MSEPASDPQDVLHRAQPGDVVAYRAPADEAPPVGRRMTIVLLPAGEGTPHRTSHLPNDAGPWEVARVEPVPEDATLVKVYLRLRG